MKIILLTQNDPFYLAESTKDFIKKIKDDNNHEIVKAIVTPASPFGKKESFIKKITNSYKIFGIKFFLYYSLKYIWRKFILDKSVLTEIKKENIPLWELNGNINSKKNISIIKSLNADIIIIIAGNQIIKKQVLEITKYGVFNVHSSLLPYYKGLMPTFWVLKNGEKQTGVTLYKLTEGIDDGPIISHKKIIIQDKMTQSTLIKKSKIVANELIIESLSYIENEREFITNKGGSYYKFPTKLDVKDFYLKGNKFF